MRVGARNDRELAMSIRIGEIVSIIVDEMTCIGRVMKLRNKTLAFVRYYQPEQRKFRGIDLCVSMLTQATAKEKESLNTAARAYNRDVTRVKSNGVTGNREKIVGVFVGVDNG